MRRVLRRATRVTAFLVVALASSADAQEGEGGTSITLTASPGLVVFRGFGGSFGTAVARLSISRDFTDNIGGEIAVVAAGMLGGASIQPGCVQGAPCWSKSTPSLLGGILLVGYAWAGGTPLRGVAGFGLMNAAGGEGFDRRSSPAVLLGLELAPRDGSGPTLGVRVAQFTSPLAGARQLLLPGIGLSF